jgi:hypothetical protein
MYVDARAPARACAFNLTNPEYKRAAILSSAASLAPLHFPTLSHKWHDSRKKVIEHKMCILIFSTTFD